MVCLLLNIRKIKAENFKEDKEKLKEKFVRIMKRRNNINFNDLSVEKQESVVKKKKAKKAAKKESANPDREDYDEEEQEELKEE
jgi:hypothetical protein